jgi:hypothetical protein
MIVSRQDAPLVAVVVGLFMGVFCGFGPTLTTAKNSVIGIIVFDLCANRWFAEAFFGLWVGAYDGVFSFNSSANFFGLVFVYLCFTLLYIFLFHVFFSFYNLEIDMFLDKQSLTYG